MINRFVTFLRKFLLVKFCKYLGFFFSFFFFQLRFSAKCFAFYFSSIYFCLVLVHFTLIQASCVADIVHLLYISFTTLLFPFVYHVIHIFVCFGITKHLSIYTFSIHAKLWELYILWKTRWAPHILHIIIWLLLQYDSWFFLIPHQYSCNIVLHTCGLFAIG
jgi:hypothetical protein